MFFFLSSTITWRLLLLLLLVSWPLVTRVRFIDRFDDEWSCLNVFFSSPNLATVTVCVCVFHIFYFCLGVCVCVCDKMVGVWLILEWYLCVYVFVKTPVDVYYYWCDAKFGHHHHRHCFFSFIKKDVASLY